MRPDRNEYCGMAALSICESLLIALGERNLLPEIEVRGVLFDAATTHENASAAASADADKEMHRTVAALINEIIAQRHTP